MRPPSLHAEVKRSVDTRISREVVGQMLDYAANAVAYLDVEKMRSVFEARCDRDGLRLTPCSPRAWGALGS